MLLYAINVSDNVSITMYDETKCCGFPAAKVYELRGRASIADACAIPGARSLEDCTKTTTTTIPMLECCKNHAMDTLFAVQDVQVLAYFMSRISPKDALREGGMHISSSAFRV